VNPRSLSTDSVETFFSVIEAAVGNPTVHVAQRTWGVLQYEKNKKMDPNRPYGFRTTARPKYSHYTLDSVVHYKSRAALPEEPRDDEAPALFAKYHTERAYHRDSSGQARASAAALADDRETAV